MDTFRKRKYHLRVQQKLTYGAVYWRVICDVQLLF